MSSSTSGACASTSSAPSSSSASAAAASGGSGSGATTGSSVLAPSKLAASWPLNTKTETKRLFAGLKASKLTDVTKAVCSSAQQQPQVQSRPQEGQPAGPSSPNGSSSAAAAAAKSVKLALDRDKVADGDKPERQDQPDKVETTVEPASEPMVPGFDQVHQNQPANSETGSNGATAFKAAASPPPPPAAATAAAAAAGTCGGSGQGFVFGQNLSERAKNFAALASSAAAVAAAVAAESGVGLISCDPAAMDSDVPTAARSSSLGATSGGEDGGNGKAEIINQQEQQQPSPVDHLKKGKSLSENAAEYLESRSRGSGASGAAGACGGVVVGAGSKRKFDEVQVITGEEGEQNVLQMNAKLYVFDNSNWLERGRGTLRLNDLKATSATTGSSNSSSGSSAFSPSSPSKGVVFRDHHHHQQQQQQQQQQHATPRFSSRLVMRTAGSLRVILNTKVYCGMTVEKPNEKNVRLIGMDDAGEVKVFLVASSPKDTDYLYRALMARLNMLAALGSPATATEASSSANNPGGGAAADAGQVLHHHHHHDDDDDLDSPPTLSSSSSSSSTPPNTHETRAQSVERDNNEEGDDNDDDDGPTKKIPKTS